MRMRVGVKVEVGSREYEYVGVEVGMTSEVFVELHLQTDHETKTWEGSCVSALAVIIDLRWLKLSGATAW
jgi:hypothetical protein